MALISYNFLSTVKTAMRSVHGEKVIKEGVSGYYLAGEVARVKSGIKIALPDEARVRFREMSLDELIRFLKQTMENVELSKYKNINVVKKNSCQSETNIRMSLTYPLLNC